MSLPSLSISDDEIAFQVETGHRKMTKMQSESDSSGLNFKETELTLGLPGGSSSGPEAAENHGKGSGKRGFSETVDLSLGSSETETRGMDSGDQPLSESRVSGPVKPPAAKAQVVGWPPVRYALKNALKSCTYVKVAADGAPYLRKVDLGMYNSYQQLLTALEKMFTCFSIRHHPNESKLMDPVNGTEYVPTYEDRDGDWMLVGDVPWKMFVESCKRLRLMKSSEAMGLAPRRVEECST